jgi:hypothetical protein
MSRLLRLILGSNLGCANIRVQSANQQVGGQGHRHHHRVIIEQSYDNDTGVMNDCPSAKYANAELDHLSMTRGYVHLTHGLEEET